MSETAQSAGDKAIEKLGEIIGLLAPKPQTQKVEPDNDVVDELYGAISRADITEAAKQGKEAAERYRNSMRWLVAAVAAIGTTLFGSAGITEIDLIDRWRWAALGVASLGLVLVLWAAVVMFEPEDASLGELAAGFDQIDRNKRPRWWSPRKQALWDLWKIVEGSGGTTHLGHPTVRDLLASIETQRIARQAAPEPPSTASETKDVCDRLLETIQDASRSDCDPKPRRAGLRCSLLEELISVLSERRRAERSSASPCGPGLRAAYLRQAVKHQKTKREFVSKRLDMLLAYRASLVADKKPRARIDKLIEEAMADDAKVRGESLATLDELEKSGRDLGVIDYQLGLDLLHRDLVLWESLVSQLRGKFRLSRRWLLAGAVITLFGVVGFVTGVKHDDPTEQIVRSGTLVVAGGTGTADGVKTACVGIELDVVLWQEEFPAADEAYTVTVTDPEMCVGLIEIPGDRQAGDVELDLNEPAVAPDGD